MAAIKRYNWANMGTSPHEVLARISRFKLGAGDLPEGIDWAMTPQGARFWARAFAKGDRRAELALARMRRQAEADAGEPAMGYDLSRLGDPETIARALRFIPNWVGSAPPFVLWANTPQGAAFWWAFFRKPVAVRDQSVVLDFTAAISRQIKERKDA